MVNDLSETARIARFGYSLFYTFSQKPALRPARFYQLLTLLVTGPGPGPGYLSLLITGERAGQDTSEV